MLALLLLTAWLRPCAAQSNELVMATTFSPSATNTWHSVITLLNTMT